MLTFDSSTTTDITSASPAHYADGVTVIDQRNYPQLGTVTNEASAAVNNGVILVLNNGAVWNVTCTSYLTSLTIAADAKVAAASGHTLTITVDGVQTAITAGKTYSGAIVLTVK
jgi:hypothetical protein